MAISHQEHRVIPVAPGTMSLKIFNLDHVTAITSVTVPHC